MRQCLSGAKAPAVASAVLCVLIAIGGGVFTWISGHRGLFLLDQSMVFDGGWRIYLGQKPFRDFLMPFGPVTFWLQALFFRLIGVQWSATVLPACLMGGIATLAAARITQRLTKSNLAAILTALITAAAFSPPFGTLWMDQTAVFFGLLALLAATEAICVAGHPAKMLAGLSGALSVVAIMSKQNFGLLMLPILLLMLWTCSSTRRGKLLLGASFVAGFLLTASGFVLYLLDSWQNYYDFSIRATSELAKERVKIPTLVRAVTFTRISLIEQPDVSGFLLGVICIFLFLQSRLSLKLRPMFPAALLAVAAPLYRSLTQALTVNEPSNGFGLTGLAIGLGVGILIQLPRVVRLALLSKEGNPVQTLSLFPTSVIAIACILIWSVFFAVRISQHSWFRTVQQFRPGTKFEQRLNVAGMNGLYWGEPTAIKTVTVSKVEFENVTQRATKKRHPFFVMGDSTILYALARVRPPQPMLYFLEGHSFSKTQANAVDRLVLEALQRNQVSTVIIEKVTFLRGTKRSISKLVRVNNWISQNFRLSEVIGNYEIWDRIDRSY